MLKIDEVSNLGAARIRIRSLLAALKDQADELAEQNAHASTCPVASLDIDAIQADIDARLAEKTGKTEGEAARALAQATLDEAEATQEADALATTEAARERFDGIPSRRVHEGDVR